MKNRITSWLIFSAIFSMFFSCNSPKVGHFHNTYKPYVKSEKSPAEIGKTDTNDQPISRMENKETISNEGITPNDKSTEAKNKNNNKLEQTSNVAISESTITPSTKREIKKEIKAGLKEVKQGATEVNTLLLVIIAILLPPVAVALVDGITGPFWLSILLTLLFYVPGLIYALYRIFRNK